MSKLFSGPSSKENPEESFDMRPLPMILGSGFLPRPPQMVPQHHLDYQQHQNGGQEHQMRSSEPPQNQGHNPGQPQDHRFTPPRANEETRPSVIESNQPLIIECT